MALSTTVSNCLYVHWAVPIGQLPVLPEDLRYQTYGAQPNQVAFVSALLFRHRGLCLDGWSWPRLSFPQVNLRLNVFDRESVPSVLFWRMWAPWWAVVSARTLASGTIPHRSLHAARLAFPSPPEVLGDEPLSWRAQRESSLCLRATLGPASTKEPRVGDWSTTVRVFRHRIRGYAVTADGELRRIETLQPEGDVVPMAVEIDDDSLLRHALPIEPLIWKTPHSAWLCPQMALRFETVAVESKGLTEGVPAPG